MIEKEGEVWCVLGLPFYAVTMESVIAWIENEEGEGRARTFGTANVNFIVLARRFPSFRGQVVENDLNFADGTPVFWCARMLNIPLPEKIAGSSLMETLSQEQVRKKKTVYFFGGARQAAQKALERTNESSFGLKAVGYCNPGFGDVGEMSKPYILEDINKTTPDILLVALGAKKGLAWIQENKKKLNVGVVSHLGAAVNFMARSIKRAPRWMQKSGLEWIWRMAVEKNLFLIKRYFFDGLYFSWIFTSRCIPLKMELLKRRREEALTELPVLEVKAMKEGTVIKIKGVCNRFGREKFREAFDAAVESDKDVIVDFSDVSYIESAFLGEAMLLWKNLAEKGRRLSFCNVGKEVRGLFSLHMAEWLLK